jgi:hypothetical protein
MPHRLCPMCKRTGRLLPAVEKSSYIDYYRCDYCGEMWFHDRQKPDSPPTPINPKVPKKK